MITINQKVNNKIAQGSGSFMRGCDIVKIEITGSIMVATPNDNSWKYERVGDAVNFEKGNLDEDDIFEIKLRLDNIFNLAEEISYGR